MKVEIDIEIKYLYDSLPDDCNYDDYSEKDLEAIWHKLPEHVKSIAYAWSTNDTEFRDAAYEWLSENRDKWQ
jgi:hypothetical protein